MFLSMLLTLPCLDGSIPRVAIIGAGGYIGSHLLERMRHHLGALAVTGYDRRNTRHDQRWPSRLLTRHLESQHIPESELQAYDVVIYLGGLTGRVACDSVSEAAVQQENVVDPVEHLARRMRPAQLLIFASTSAIMEGSGEREASEHDAIHEELLDRYTASMWQRERWMRKLAIEHVDRAPQLIGLRFGTVIGVSAGQRVDLSPMALVRAAYATGVLRMVHGETHRAFLDLQDLGNAVQRVVHTRNRAPRMAIYHLRSFNANIAALVNAVAARTGARIEGTEHEGADIVGFSLNGSAFERTFNFSYRGTLHSVVANLDARFPQSVTPQGAHVKHTYVAGWDAGNTTSHPSTSIACPVCGSHHLQESLDLHMQPLANDFRPSAAEALGAERYPLKLMHCRSCHHMHLSHLVSRPHLFSNYLYVSGTSRTLLRYFDWLAEKVENETTISNRRFGQGCQQPRAVLEIACNDGSQLDSFKRRGWRTYGVDAAANIVPIAVAKGHNVRVGFWGDDLSASQVPVDAIVAQNVLAHVPSPVAFLQACAAAMGSTTKLYIQTSQCNMHQQAQFDTAYHEHLSFFTSRSFRRAAELSKLQVIDFMVTPIHGDSCLWTLMRADVAVEGHAKQNDGNVAAPFAMRLEKQAADGLMTDFFYDRFSARAHAIRDWLLRYIRGLQASGHRLFAYGAAAKGMTLRHFLIGALHQALILASNSLWMMRHSSKACFALAQ